MNLMRRKIIADGCCEICQGQQKDVLHALYQCLKLEELWSLTPVWNHSSLKQKTSFLDLIGSVFAENRDPACFSMVVWALWNRRNNLRLGKASGTLGQLFSLAKDKAKEFSLHNTTMTSTMQRIPDRWTPSGDEYYKVNFDGPCFRLITVRVYEL